MVELSRAQIVAALFAYDVALEGKAPDLATRAEAMRAAINAAFEGIKQDATPETKG